MDIIQVETEDFILKKKNNEGWIKIHSTKIEEEIATAIVKMKAAFEFRSRKVIFSCEESEIFV